MKQEDKELLLTDLCARLPYRVKCLVNYTFCNETTDYEDVKASTVDTITTINQETESYCFERLSEWFDVDEFKPYLFPMSSMTEEQAKIFLKLESMCFLSSTDKLGPKIEFFEWLNRNHFDYRGLIEKGLAIDCTNLNIY